MFTTYATYIKAGETDDRWNNSVYRFLRKFYLKYVVGGKMFFVHKYYLPIKTDNLLGYHKPVE
jgi:hypothetical protein